MDADGAGPVRLASIGEAYIQQLASFGWYADDDDNDGSETFWTSKYQFSDRMWTNIILLRWPMRDYGGDYTPWLSVLR